MRSYPLNSPHAAARIVALTLLSDGQFQPTELAMLEAIQAHEQLGLTRHEWHDVVHEFCADLLASATRSTDCLIDSRTIARLLADVDNVTLQCLVLRLCTALINADRQVDKGESIVLLAAIDHWGLHPVGLGTMALHYALHRPAIDQWGLHPVGLEPLEPLPHDLDPNGCGHARCTMNILDLS